MTNQSRDFLDGWIAGPLRCDWVHARYADQPNRHYRGNPFIEALPRIMKDADILSALYGRVEVTDEDRAMDREDKMLASSVLGRFFKPMSIHVDLYRKVIGLMLGGLSERNPMAPEWYGFTLEIEKTMAAMMAAQGGYAGLHRAKAGRGMAGTGDSGVGKSVSVAQFMRTMPTVIVHSNFRGRPFSCLQIPALFVRIPPDGSLRQLCKAIFAVIDALLRVPPGFDDRIAGGTWQTNYLRLHGHAGMTVDEMLPKVAYILHLHGVGILVVDELQNLSIAKSGGKEKTLNFFSALMDGMGVPVLVIGTESAAAMLSCDFPAARRLSSMGHLKFPRMGPGREFLNMCQSLNELTLLDGRTELTAETLQRIYFHSQGITDLIVKLFALSEYRALQFGRTSIEANTIDEVAAHSFGLLAQYLENIRTGRPVDQDAFHKLLKSRDLQVDSLIGGLAGDGDGGAPQGPVAVGDTSGADVSAASAPLAATTPGGRKRGVAAKAKVAAGTAKAAPRNPSGTASKPADAGLGLAAAAAAAEARGEPAHLGVRAAIPFMDLAALARAA